MERKCHSVHKLPLKLINHNLKEKQQTVKVRQMTKYLCNKYVLRTSLKTGKTQRDKNEANTMTRASQ